jgi:hypothetical protein
MPCSNRDQIRKCKCGCDTFRFKMFIDDIERTRDWYDTICRNCEHTLKQHTIQGVTG